MENSILSHESFKLLTSKCRTIIRNNFLWYAMHSKYHSELFNRAMGFNRMHESHIHPFRMGIHQYKKCVPNKDLQNQCGGGSTDLPATPMGGAEK